MGTTVTTNFTNHFVNDWFLLSDFTDMFVGGLIGEGCSRSVYEYRMNPKYVIKIDRSGQFNNVSEWDIWHNIKSIPEISKFFAPCIHLSSCGRVLIQKKTTEVMFDELPKLIPSLFADVKIQNWGKIGKDVVCHDYANHSLFTMGKELIEVDWRR